MKTKKGQGAGSFNRSISIQAVQEKVFGLEKIKHTIESPIIYCRLIDEQVSVEIVFKNTLIVLGKEYGMNGVSIVAFMMNNLQAYSEVEENH